MTLVVGIVHSSTGEANPAVRATATACLTALHCALAPTAPDLVPRMAVLQADPCIGARYLYQCVVQDTNHAVATASTYACCSSGSSSGGGGGSGEAASGDDFSGLFRFRSPALLRQCLQCHLAPGDSKKDEESEEGKGDGGGRDPWASLAGALLTSLCFLVKYRRPSLVAPPPEEPAAGSAEAPPLLRWTDAGVAHTPSLVLIFTDGGGDDTLSFATDAALAAAVTKLAALDARVVCYGRREAAGGRLGALCASTSGYCADAFELRDVGALLSLLAPPPVAAAQSSLPAAEAAEEKARQRRRRLTEQYVVAPAMLSVDGQTSSHGSYMGWLCPRCMAVVEEGSPHSRAGDSGDGEPRMCCPFCSE